MKIRTLLTAALVALILMAPLRTLAQTQTEKTQADRWTFSVMPFFWLPGLDGKLNKVPPLPGAPSPNVSVDPDDVFDALDFAFMISGEARKGRWLIGMEVMYADFSGVNSAVRSIDFNLGGPINISTTELNAGTDTSIDALVWTLVGGYSAVKVPRATLDLIFGLRYLGLDMTTDWKLKADVTGTGPLGKTETFQQMGRLDRSADIWTPIVGAKGRVKLGESSWFVPYYVDIGLGSATFTWQGSGGIGYAFRWGDVRLTYRYLYYDQDSDDKLFNDLSAGGVSLGVNFVF